MLNIVNILWHIEALDIPYSKNMPLIKKIGIKKRNPNKTMKEIKWKKIKNKIEKIK